MILLCRACFEFVIVLTAAPNPRLPRRRCCYCGCELLDEDPGASRS